MSARALLGAGALLLAACQTASSAGPPADARGAAAFPASAWNQACANHDDWDLPGPPFHIYGNSWYVGTCGIAAVLVAGSDGHVLIDGGTEAAGPLIAANVARLGFDIKDVKVLLLTHEHFDHAGGLAFLRQASGARMLASPAQAAVLTSGKPDPDDPQATILSPFPTLEVGATLADGEIVRLGDIAIAALATPGHTEGAMSFSWRACEAGDGNERCRQIVYLDSLSAVSSDDYRFADHPSLVDRFRATYASVAAIAPCDIVLTPHPAASRMPERIGSPGGLSAEGGCAAYAAAMGKRLDDRLATERAGR